MPQFSEISCPIDKCLGRILRQTIVSDRPFPPFDRSMMDGYAIRAEEIDSSGTFNITAQCPAGETQKTLGATVAVCAEIMTGAIVPTDANCVVPYETTKRLSDTKMQLIDRAAHSSGDCIHKLGSDRGKDETLLGPGVKLGARELAVAASCGYADILVSKRPSVAIVSTGDELVEISQKPEAHQIRRSNDLTVKSALLSAGFPATEMVHLIDDPAECTKELRRLIAENEIVIISGGVSMGKKDYIPGILNELGLSCQFHGVAQKPGKPLGFWSNQSTAIFALPGNPNSTLACLHHYVIPALQVASGGDSEPATKVKLAAPVKSHSDLTVFLPVSLEANNIATPRPTRNSGDLVSILRSDGYIELPASEKAYSINTELNFYRWM